MSDDPRMRLERLLAELASSDAPVPTSPLGRLRRTLGTAARLGAGALGSRLRSGDLDLDLDLIARTVTSLGELKGVAMKVGQIMSYADDGLPEDARRLLAVLQVRSQPTPFADVEATLRRELGRRADPLLERLEREPIASASIGQVHRGWLGGGAVAVKVRHPGIEDAIRADFRLAQTGKTLARLLAPGANVAEVIEEAEARFLEECDYGAERSFQERFHTLLAGDADLAVPEVLAPWCSRGVLTSRFVEGRSFDAFVAAASQPERDRVGRALYRFYLGSLYRHGLFNADPHPGNLLFPTGGGVVVVDFGCVREFDPATVVAVATMSRAVREDDVTAMRDALVALGVPRPPRSEAFEATRGLLRAFFQPALEAGPHRVKPDVLVEARQAVRTKRQILGLRLPGRLLFLFRIRFGLHAVLARLGAEVDWRALEAELADGVGGSGARRLPGAAPG